MRRQTNYKDFYFVANGGPSIGTLSISDEVENNAKTQTGLNDIRSSLLFGFDLAGETGFLYYHRKTKKLKGLGFLITGGYRLNLSGIMTNPSPPDTNELAPILSRWDIVHGPFIKGNILF